MSANTIWNVAESEFPAGGSAHQKLGHALKCATEASGTERRQSWQFRLGEDHIELIASADRVTESVDPDGRTLMMKCGDALFHLKLALKRVGCLGRVEMFPDLDQPGLVARIHYGSSPGLNSQEAVLLDAMTRGRKNAEASNDAPVSEAILESFRGSVPVERAWLEFSQSESSRQRLLTLAGSGMPPSTASHRSENQLAVRVTQKEASQGTPKNSRIAQWTRPFLTFTRRTVVSGKISVELRERRADQMAALAVLKTKTDDKHGWLAAGKAVGQLRLQALALDVPCRVFDQVFWNRHVREELRTTFGRKGFVQAIIGFGSNAAQWTIRPPAQQPTTATMR